MSCNSDRVTGRDVLARVGKETLTRGQLNRQIPPGLSSNDSVKLARAYVRDWIDRQTVGVVAARNIPDMEEIDRMVAEYRNELISWEYRRLMSYEHADTMFHPDTLQAYYDRNVDDFKLHHPIVKGVFIKIADSSPSLKQVRKIYRSHDAADIDCLEKKDFTGVIHFDYFRNRWVDWEQIESRMPFDFGNDANAFLRNHKNAEITVGGFVYLLEISEFMPSGSIMPYDYAGELIREALINERRIDYDRRLRYELYNRGIENGDIEIFCDLD